MPLLFLLKVVAYEVSEISTSSRSESHLREYTELVNLAVGISRLSTLFWRRSI